MLLTGGKIYSEGKLDKDMIMEIFVAYSIMLCSYFLAKALIRSGHANLMALMQYQNQQKSMEEQLKLDPFTGLYNKKTFDQWLPQLMEGCRKSNLCLSLAIIDIDKFKHVNDVYGYTEGDRVLLHLAHILNSNSNDNILAFGIGGDEFAIIFKGYCVKEAYKICEGLRSIMDISLLNGLNKLQVTFSCGLACMNLNHTSPIKLLKATDSALYTAKKRII